MAQAATATAPRYIVQDLFPVNRTSIICGTSGAGKSRWLLAAIADWLEGKPILGRASTPQPCAYISCDRPSEATHDLIDRMNLGQRLSSMPIYSLMDANRTFDFRQIPPIVGSEPRVLFIEAFQVLIPNGDMNKYWHVLDFFRQWNQMCRANNYTSIGSCHEPKMKDGEGYSLHRDRIMGTAAWAAAVETIVTLEMELPKDIECTQRRLTVLPRNERPWQQLLDFDARGYLVESQQEYQMGEWLLTMELARLQVGATVSTLQVKQWALAKSVSESTVYRWLRESAYLEKVKKGLYLYKYEAKTKKLQ